MNTLLENIKNLTKNKHIYPLFVLILVGLGVIALISSSYGINSGNVGSNSQSSNGSQAARNSSSELDQKAFSELEKIASSEPTSTVNGTSTGNTTAQGEKAEQSEEVNTQNIVQTSGETSANNQNISSGQQFTTGFVYTLFCTMTDFLTSGCTDTSTTGSANYYGPARPTSAISTLSDLTGALYTTKTVSAEVWAQDLADRVTQKAQAQEDSPTYNPGSGYNLLTPVRELWRTTSNIVYIFYIVIVIAIAFLIVLRQQLDGQNAVNLFNSIPSIIISLVLVFFSYPLSAVFIDLVTVGGGVVYGVLVGTPGSTAPGAFLHERNITYDAGGLSNPITIFDPAFQNTSYTAQNGLQMDDRFTSVWQVFNSAGVFLDANGISKIVPDEAPVAEVIRAVIQAFADTLGGSILALVFAFAAFTAQINLFFKLAREYIVLTFYVVISPFFFLVAAIPGQTGNFISQYFRKLLAASVSFIAVYALFLIIIIVGRSTGGVGDPAWLPPLLGYSTGGLPTGETINEVVRTLLAYFLFLSAPLIPDTVQNLIAGGQNDVNLGANFTRSLQQGAASAIGTTLAPLDRSIKGALDVNPRQRG